ncbi:ABC transporter permease subunit [Candidatus Poribacteria bacterium]|nr:ABC transporter permease subunit [Candidatus Poribacteria bacterium]MYA55857.1 ABC transporter permease subunit [Candidatus Poribacteria bacterium]
MIWYIAKRELYDNLNSLRFALATVLLFGLMLTNAVVHLREQPARIQRYLTTVTDARNALETRADSLYELARKGPGKLYKKPSPLHFCAEGGDPFLSGAVQSDHYFWENEGLKSFWQMRYPSATPNLTNIRPDVTKIDWAFVIGYVLSLIALLFTFDAIAGERERGTLRLMLANSVPRHTVLIGKFLGALVSISISFAFAVLINLSVISTSSAVHLGADVWVRSGIVCFVALLYTSLFLALGLLVSTRVQRSAVSLMILLLMWVTFVIFTPSILALITSGFSSPMSYDELRVHQNRINDKHLEQYWRVLGRSKSETLQAASKYVTQEAAEQERLIEKRLNEQVAQVQQARSITRISPTAILQHLLESFAGTGFERHLQFLENAQHYAREYREFVIDTDNADPESLHLIGVREGMSQKPVNPDAVPIFEDALSLSKDFNAAAMDLLLLTLFVVVLLAGAYLAFVRLEI